MDIEIKIKTKQIIANEPLVQINKTVIKGLPEDEGDLKSLVSVVFDCLTGLGYSTTVIEKYIDRYGCIDVKNG